MPRKSVTAEEFIPFKNMTESHDKLLRGNGTDKGLCEQQRIQAERHFLLRADHDTFVEETKPVLKDYTDNKNKIIGGAKLALVIMFLITLINGYMTLTNKNEYKKSIEVLSTISEQLKDIKIIKPVKGGK